MLEIIGIQWDTSDSREHWFDLTKGYLAQHDHLKIPMKYKTMDGIWLDQCLYEQKQDMTK